MWRQGDLLITKIVPQDIRGRQQKDNVLALGELTGHSHTLMEGTVFQDGGDKYLILPTMSKIVHQEHKPIDLEAGAYKVVRQRQYNTTRNRSEYVAD